MKLSNLLTQMCLSVRVRRDERGATAVEYGLMVAMIAIVIIGGVTLFGTRVTALFSIPADLFVKD